MLEENVTEELIHAALRAGTISREITPVLMGSAYKNKEFKSSLMLLWLAAWPSRGGQRRARYVQR